MFDASYPVVRQRRSSLTRDVSERVLRREGVKAVHFSISCLPSRSEGRDAWLETIEYFFFSLLVLRECSDTSSGICNVLQRLAIRYYAWERANTTRALSTRAVEETKMNVTRVVFSRCGVLIQTTKIFVRLLRDFEVRDLRPKVGVEFVH